MKRIALQNQVILCVVSFFALASTTSPLMETLGTVEHWRGRRSLRSATDSLPSLTRAPVGRQAVSLYLLVILICGLCLVLLSLLRLWTMRSHYAAHKAAHDKQAIAALTERSPMRISAAFLQYIDNIFPPLFHDEAAFADRSLGQFRLLHRLLPALEVPFFFLRDWLSAASPASASVSVSVSVSAAGGGPDRNRDRKQLEVVADERQDRRRVFALCASQALLALVVTLFELQAPLVDHDAESACARLTTNAACSGEGNGLAVLGTGTGTALDPLLSQCVWRAATGCGRRPAADCLSPRATVVAALVVVLIFPLLSQALYATIDMLVGAHSVRSFLLQEQERTSTLRSLSLSVRSDSHRSTSSRGPGTGGSLSASSTSGSSSAFRSPRMSWDGDDDDDPNHENHHENRLLFHLLRCCLSRRRALSLTSTAVHQSRYFFHFLWYTLSTQVVVLHERELSGAIEDSRDIANSAMFAVGKRVAELLQKWTKERVRQKQKVAATWSLFDDELEEDDDNDHSEDHDEEIIRKHHTKHHPHHHQKGHIQSENHNDSEKAESETRLATATVESESESESPGGLRCEAFTSPVKVSDRKRSAPPSPSSRVVSAAASTQVTTINEQKDPQTVAERETEPIVAMEKAEVGVLQPIALFSFVDSASQSLPSNRLPTVSLSAPTSRPAGSGGSGTGSNKKKKLKKKPQRANSWSADSSVTAAPAASPSASTSSTSASSLTARQSTDRSPRVGGPTVRREDPSALIIEQASIFHTPFLSPSGFERTSLQVQVDLERDIELQRKLLKTDEERRLFDRLWSWQPGKGFACLPPSETLTDYTEEDNNKFNVHLLPTLCMLCHRQGRVQPSPVTPLPVLSPVAPLAVAPVPTGEANQRQKLLESMQDLLFATKQASKTYSELCRASIPLTHSLARTQHAVSYSNTQTGHMILSLLIADLMGGEDVLEYRLFDRFSSAYAPHVILLRPFVRGLLTTVFALSVLTLSLFSLSLSLAHDGTWQRHVVLVAAALLIAEFFVFHSLETLALSVMLPDLVLGERVRRVREQIRNLVRKLVFSLSLPADPKSTARGSLTFTFPFLNSFYPH
jgi:hypothetical protein